MTQGDLGIELPSQVAGVIAQLERGGFEAYAVGGCVRDAAMGRVPGDWDVCSSATPGEVAACFAGEARVIETGARHGTVTVVLDALSVEVTTYRADGAYSDARRPDSVTFVRSLKEDLARRDFTVNAMAYHPQRGIVDPFGGMADIRARTIRCVGGPQVRLEEDALRILRALRFAATLDFDVERETQSALHAQKGRLGLVSAERVRAELDKLLCSGAARRVSRAFADVLGEVLGELTPCIGFAQHNPHHCYDVFEHTLCAVEAIAPQPVLRLAMLLHDIGKPDTFTLDAAGVGHFHGHVQRGTQMAREILRRLKYDNATQERVLTLVRYHDARLGPETGLVKRWLRKLGAEAFGQLIEVQRADAMARHAAYLPAALEQLERIQAAAEAIVAAGECVALSSLAVDGDDLLAAGFPAGRALGRMLDALLFQVMDGALPNERGALLDWARRQL